MYVRARIRGAGPFPVEMLFEDKCYPRDRDYARTIAATFGHLGASEPWSVVVERHAFNAEWAWDEPRWREHGCEVENLG